MQRDALTVLVPIALYVQCSCGVKVKRITIHYLLLLIIRLEPLRSYLWLLLHCALVWFDGITVASEAQVHSDSRYVLLQQLLFQHQEAGEQLPCQQSSKAVQKLPLAMQVPRLQDGQPRVLPHAGVHGSGPRGKRCYDWQGFMEADATRFQTQRPHGRYLLAHGYMGDWGEVRGGGGGGTFGKNCN